MEHIAHKIGELAVLALILMSTVKAVTELIRFVWKQGFMQQHVAFDDGMAVLLKSFFKPPRYARLRLLATAAAMIVVIVSWIQGTAFLAAFGYGIVVFAIAGVATPAILRFARITALSAVLRFKSHENVDVLPDLP